MNNSKEQTGKEGKSAEDIQLANSYLETLTRSDMFPVRQAIGYGFIAGRQSLQQRISDLESQIQDLEPKFTELEMECKSLKAELKRKDEALIDLVNLKHHKDTFGKDDHYTKWQPIVWANAEQALKPKDI